LNKYERFSAAVTGGAVDRPPVTAWVHFQSDHLSGAKTAELHANFLRAYDWDVLKVMNDYRYPVPEGVTTLTDASSLAAYRRLDMAEPSFTRQLDCLKRLQDADLRTPMLETVFEPFQQIVRNIGFGQGSNLLKHRKAALQALEVVTETVCEYVATVKAMGVEGIFISVNGAMPETLPRGVTAEDHDILQKPFTKAVLEAAAGMVRVLHVHGNRLDMTRVLDYPCEVLSVSDRLADNPSLATLRGMTDKCLMGGLDETRLPERTLPELAAEVDDAVRQAGRSRCIVAPGCTIPSFTPQRVLSYLGAYVGQL